jgi:hypothetical protein
MKTILYKLETRCQVQDSKYCHLNEQMPRNQQPQLS